MTRVLVTGGSGFIGTAVIKELMSNRPDLEVRAIDLHPPVHDRVESHSGSILDINCVSGAVQNCDYVLHMAAMLGVRKTDARRAECLNANVLGTINVLDACVKERVKKVVFMSSSEVYGDQVTFPISETNPLNPKSVYAVSKLAGEEYCRAYGARYGLDHSIVRFFNVYGPGQVAEFVIPRFVKAALDGDVPTVYGSGDQVRAFNHVSDAARGVVMTMMSDSTRGETINIGNDTEPISMADLARRVLKLAGGANREPRFVSLGRSDRTAEREIFKRIPDISKARALLGWAPQVPLNEGLQSVIGGGIIEPTWRNPVAG